MTLRLQGFAALDRELEKLSKAAGKSVLRRSLIKSAEPMAEIARGLAPDDPATDGFDLKKSIKVGTRLSRSAKKKHKKTVRDDKASVEVFVGAGPLAQAIFTEFGTAPHINGGKFAGSENPGTPPRPYMRPAWDRDKKALIDRLGAELFEQIEKSVKRAEARAAKAAASS